MTLTDRDLQLLRYLRRYFYLRTRQIIDLIAPHDDDGSIMRARLRLLEKEGLVRRYLPKLIDPLDPQTSAPIWILTLKGSATLTRMAEDCSLLLTCEPSFADWMSLGHFTRVSSAAILIDRAVAAQKHVTLRGLTFEHEVLDPRAEDPSKKFRLYTRVSEEPKVVCVPDAAFLLDADGRRRAFYVEYETGSDTPARVAAKKSKGYALLHTTKKFREHFSDAGDFRVLCFCPHASFRDALRRELKDKAGAGLWLFITTSDVTAETFLHGDIVYKADEKPGPLVPAPAEAPVTVSAGG